MPGLALLARHALTRPQCIGRVSAFEIVIGKDSKIKQIDNTVLIEVARQICVAEHVDLAGIGADEESSVGGSQAAGSAVDRLAPKFAAVRNTVGGDLVCAAGKKDITSHNQAIIRTITGD